MGGLEKVRNSMADRRFNAKRGRKNGNEKNRWVQRPNDIGFGKLTGTFHGALCTHAKPAPKDHLLLHPAVRISEERIDEFVGEIDRGGWTHS